MKLTESMLNQMIQEELGIAFNEGEVVDFQQRKMSSKDGKECIKNSQLIFAAEGEK